MAERKFNRSDIPKANKHLKKTGESLHTMAITLFGYKSKRNFYRRLSELGIRHFTQISSSKNTKGAQSKYSIDDLKSFAAQKNGECLSDTFYNSDEKYDWKCAFNHLWRASFNQIKNKKSWCPLCARVSRRDKSVLRFSIKNLILIAKSRGGKCLSEEFLGTNKRYLWECRYGHVWRATHNSVKNGTWCPTCAYKIKGEARRSKLK